MKRRLTTTVLLAVLFCATLLARTRPDALEMYRQGRYDEAIQTCLSEIEENPNNVESYVVLSWSLVRAHRYAEADSWSEKGRRISRFDPRLIQIQGEARYFLGKNEEALRLFQDYITFAPNGSRIGDVYYFKGEIYLRQSRFRHADIALSTAVQIESMNGLWWTRLGYAREMSRDFRPSLDAYSRALALSPGLKDAQRGRERVMRQLD